MSKYSVNNYSIDVILGWYKSGEIAIPEIQRPFVWVPKKVRNLIDSLYNGYPIGYLTIWKNPNVRLRGGRESEGKKILIDGQQRVISLITSILGEEVVTKDYKKTRITISFNPITEKFEVWNPAIERDPEWIQDIGPIITREKRSSEVVRAYCERNPPVDRNKIEDTLDNLKDIEKRQIGVIQLEHDLDIETVTEIFVRINSEGVPLNQADFAMSKIASNESQDGPILRKTIDYFCHLVRAPEFFGSIRRLDEKFSETEFFQKISWLKNNNQDIYKPDYSDMLRVAFTSEFNRGKLADLASLLSGRNFETRTYEERIIDESFAKLRRGILNFVNETNFNRFIMIIKSAGFVSSDMIRSKNALNFAYILYLKLRAQQYDSSKIERYVRKWFVLSILTKRYSGSPESQFDFDIRNISSRRFEEFIEEVESAQLSDAYWNSALPQNLRTPVASSPYFNIFLAAQVKSNDKGFLSRDITVKDLILQKGDVHHIFPREYLKSKGLKREKYNQIANYVFTQSEINIKIGKKSPKEYMSDVWDQCNGGELKYGSIADKQSLLENFRENAIPEDLKDMEYDEFLERRRKLMAMKIKDYYKNL